MTDESLTITCVEMWALLIQADTTFKAQRLNLKCWLSLRPVDVYCFLSSLLSSLAVALTRGNAISRQASYVYLYNGDVCASLPTFDFVLGEKSNYYFVYCWDFYLTTNRAVRVQN